MPCNPSPCSVNAICRERNGVGSCTCKPNFYGDPYVNCRPECLTSSECDFRKSCMNNRCIDPCLEKSMCGVNAICKTVNHSPQCSCLSGYTGNALNSCYEIREFHDEKKDPQLFVFIYL